MKQLEEQQMALEQAKVAKPPTVSAALGDVDKLPPDVQAQFLGKFFGLQADPNTMVDKDAQKNEIENQKSQMDLQSQAVKTKMDLEAKAQEMGMKQQGQALDLQAKDVQSETRRTSIERQI